jgi:hypothetical protein
MTRRTVIGSPMLLGAQRAWNILFKGLAPAWAASGQAQTRANDVENGILLENSNHNLEFDRKNARLLSLRANIAPDQEFAIPDDQLSVFVIQYLSSEKQFWQIASTTAMEVNVRSAEKTLTADFTGLGGLDLAATVTIRMIGNDPASYWSIPWVSRNLPIRMRIGAKWEV